MLPDLSDIDPKHVKITLSTAATGGDAEDIKVRCPCGHMAKMPLQPLIEKYGPQVTFNHIERLARCTACGGRKDLDARAVYTARLGANGVLYST